MRWPAAMTRKTVLEYLEIGEASLEREIIAERKSPRNLGERVKTESLAMRLINHILAPIYRMAGDGWRNNQ